MKYLLTLSLFLTSLFAHAGDKPPEVFVSIEPTVQLVLVNAPCEKFKAAEHVQLNYAYAINIETGDKVDGCFTHVGDIIQIELVDENGNFYSYKVHANLFLPRPNL